MRQKWTFPKGSMVGLMRVAQSARCTYDGACQRSKG